MANRIKGITIEIDGNTTPLEKSLKDVNKTISKTQSELKDVDRLLKLDPGNVQLLNQKQGLLATAIKETSKKLDEEKKALEQLKATGNTEETQAQQRALEREIIATEQSLSKLTEESIKNEKALKGDGDAAEDSGKKAEKGSKGWSVLKGAIANLAADAAKAAGRALKNLGKQAVKAVDEAAKAGDEIDKMSQKLGMSRKGYQEWDFVLSQAGVDINSLQTGMKTMTNQIGQAKGGAEKSVDTFKALGISVEDLNKMTREESFASIVKSLQGMEDSTERAALANKLFGKSGQNLTPLFNETAESTDELIKKANELGMVMGDDAVDAGVAYEDQLASLQHTFEATKNGIISNLLPGVTEAMSGFQELIMGTEGGAEKLEKGVNDIINNASKVFSQFKGIISPILTTVISILPSIFKGISDAIIALFPDLLNAVLQILPGLMSTLATLAVQISSSILLMLPQIVRAVVGLVAQLLPQLGTMLPQIVTEIIKIVPLLVSTLIANIPALLRGAITFLNAIITAIPTIIQQLTAVLPKLINSITSFLIKPATINLLLKSALILLGAILKAVPKIIGSLSLVLPKVVAAITSALVKGAGSVKEAAGELFGKIKEKAEELKEKAKTWAHDMIDSFIQGIKDRITALANAAKNIGKTIKDYIGFSEPKKGDLSNFHTFAPDMIDLFIKGINESMPKLENALSGMAAGMLAAEGGSVTNNRNVTVNQYNSYANSHSQYEIWKSEQNLKRAIKTTVRGMI